MSALTQIRGQRGAALAVGLFFLLILSLSLVAAFRASILQERMAGGFRNASLATHGAESALRAGEQWVWDWFVNNEGTLAAGERPFVRQPAPIDGSTAANFRQSRDWIDDGEPYTNAEVAETTYARLAEQPRFVVETILSGSDLGAVSHPGGYGTGSRGVLVYQRVTGRSTGGSREVVRAVESTFVVVD